MASRGHPGGASGPLAPCSGVDQLPGSVEPDVIMKQAGLGSVGEFPGFGFCGSEVGSISHIVGET